MEQKDIREIVAHQNEEGKKQIEERIFNIRGRQVMIDNYIDDTVLTMLSTWSGRR